MPAKIAIGLTTYLDITEQSFGAAVFDAYLSTSTKITPNRVAVWSKKHPVQTREDFARFWLTRGRYEVRSEKRAGYLVDSGELIVGAKWRCVRRLPGEGEVAFRSERDTSGPNCIRIIHNYSAAVDWPRLFEELIIVTTPSYAMLHLFTPAELTRARTNQYKFDGPIVGEDHFTSWLSNLGHWRKPDRWDAAARRQYRYLTDLSWANFLGTEFEGQFDPATIEKLAAKARTLGNGFAFQVTGSLADVERHPDEFNRSRDLLKGAFRHDFFRQQ